MKLPFSRLLAALALACPLLAQAQVSGDSVIRAPYAGSEIVITTTERLAGAVHSLKWMDHEFIDSVDHGRQLQSASNLDAGQPIAAETFNPTEAGSRLDSAGPKTSSRLLHLLTTGSALETTSQMAFWLTPGEKSGPNPARNTTVLSNHLLTKRLQIGYKNLPNVIPYDVTFGVPIGELHHHAVFEALTGYMPADFSQFLQLDEAKGELIPLTDGPGEIPHPVVLATADSAFAMGIYAPPQPRPAMTGPSYGRFRFGPEKVVKWNCVFRLTEPAGVVAGDYSFRMFVVIGDVPSVLAGLQALRTEFAGK